MTLLILVFAHLLADYPLQGNFLAKMKGERLLLMMTHCAIWTGCVATAAHLAGLHVFGGMLAMLFGVHFAADEAKAQRVSWPYTVLDPLGGALWLDQGIHFVQLLLVLWIGGPQ